MPRLSGDADPDDLGASDELIAFKDEGEQEEKRSTSAERDLDDVKSSLVNESESNSGSEAEVSVRGARGPHPCGGACGLSPPVRVCVQADRLPRSRPDAESRTGLGHPGDRGTELLCVSAAPVAFWVLWGSDLFDLCGSPVGPAGLLKVLVLLEPSCFSCQLL